VAALAIRVDDLGKRYRLGTPPHLRTLKETLSDLGRTTVRRGSPDASTLWALRHATFEVEAGEVLGVVGRNGAGKSTLLKLLARVAVPSEGRAEIHGRLGALLEVGTGFHPELTGRENVFLNGAILGMTRAEIRARFDEIVAFAEIERFLDTPVKRYSHGMYMRLAFAVAAHVEPDVLIVDEVLAVGDAGFQRKCLARLRGTSAQGCTVILVSHQMTPIVTLTRRCLLVDGGRIALDAETPRVVAAYGETTGAAADQESDLGGRTRGHAATTGEAQFVHVRATGGTNGLRAGGPLEVSVRLRARDALRGLAVGVAVAHPNGTWLFSARSDRDGVTCDVPAGREASVRVRIAEPHLAPGLYVLHLDAFADGARHVDSVPAALRLEVLPAAADTIGWQEMGTGLWLAGEWQTGVA
jgi:lipopolysaccharide transport system ATP-binding protein